MSRYDELYAEWVGGGGCARVIADVALKFPSYRERLMRLDPPICEQIAHHTWEVLAPLLIQATLDAQQPPAPEPQPEPEPQPRPSGPSRGAWGDTWRPRATFGTGSYQASTEFPGLEGHEQDRFIAKWVESDATHVEFAVVNGDTSTQNGKSRSAYDGLRDPEVLRPTLAKLAAAKLIPMMALFQGARSSWNKLNTKEVRGFRNDKNREQFGYSNEWAKDGNLRRWADRVIAMWRELAGPDAPRPWFTLGWEADEGFYDEANRDERGMVEKYGHRAYRDIWAPALHAAGFLVNVHYLTDRWYPQPGQGGVADWGGVRYFADGRISAVQIQTASDDDRSIDDQVRVVEKARREMDPIRTKDGERVRVWAGEYAKEGGDEARARRAGQRMLAVCDGALNGF